MFSEYDDNRTDLFNFDDEEDELEEKKENEKRYKEFLTSESYKSAMEVHYKLPLDANPSREKLEWICNLAHSENLEDRQTAYKYMLGCTSSFILATIKKRYRTYMPLHMQDMLQQGYCAIIKDIDDFDPKKGSVTTFYASRVDHEIQAYINKLHGSTPHYTSALRKIKEFVKGRKEKDLDYNFMDICIETGLGPETVRKCLNIQDAKNVSIDAADIVDTFKSPYLTPEESYELKEKNDYLYGLLDKSGLTDIERVAVCLRYGLSEIDDKTRSFSEIRTILESYGYYMTQSEIQKAITDAEEKMRIEDGRTKMAKNCHRLRDNADRRVSGDLLSKMAMLSDQEAVAEYQDKGILFVN